MSDDHTSQAWGIYGGVLAPFVQNSGIDRLAREGARLTNVFCTNSICVPSRGSIMTGRYSHQNGIYTLAEALSPDSNSVAKELQKGGYETALIGKWHLKDKPAGFDYWKVLPGQGRYHDPILLSEDNFEAGEIIEGFSSDVIGDLSIDWLNSRNAERPFFLMTHFKATHEPFDYPERYDTLYENIDLPEVESLFDFTPEATGRSFIGQKLDILGERYENDDRHFYPGSSFSLEGLSREEARAKTYQKFVKDFLRSGAAINDNIEKLLKYLDENDLTENTVVVYTADQGYFLGEHGFFDKRMFYEESVRMPFVVRYPAEIESGSVVDEMVLNLDFPSLFLDYGDLSAPEYMQGKSFRQALQGHENIDKREDFYYRYWLHQTNRPAHFGVRNSTQKLIFYYGQPLGMPGAHKESTEPAWEFFDLENDPNELHNAYGEVEYQVDIQKLKSRLLELRKEIGDTDEEFPVMDSIMRIHW